MDITTDKKLIELISLKYKEIIHELNILIQKREEIYERLQDKNIKHNDFLFLTKQLENHISQYDKIRSVAYGIDIAKSVVIDYILK